MPGCHFTVSLSNYLCFHLCHYLDQKPEEAQNEDGEEDDGSAETAEPGRAEVLDPNWTFRLGQLGFHFGTHHTRGEPAEKVD